MQYANTYPDRPFFEECPVTHTGSKKNDPLSSGSEIIGDSDAIRHIMHLVGKVAASESSILILGETGTGKELIAQAIHQHSPRSSKPMIKVNCGALPVNLIESELFGHEKGSFTGAFERRIGKFEMAHGSTLFLDEIGEMPAELQVKLLRVLQEREFERIGGKTSIKVNVRIIAATNRDLEHEMMAGRFRSDLFYRLNVFPITVPPLRDRRADVHALAEFFFRRYCSREKKTIPQIPVSYLNTLAEYQWPGNIRELENIIARCVLLSTADEFYKCPAGPVMQTRQQGGGDTTLKTIAQNEIDHILKALAVCNDKIYGPDGAAALLNINASTLLSRMRKFGIRRRFTA
jgi:transcriptional regulator with GAF, ATPase, and Fis domain